jgi:hypothetical protein
MKVEIGTEAPIFLFWEYLFQILGILSLQCSKSKHGYNPSNEAVWQEYSNVWSLVFNFIEV